MQAASKAAVLRRLVKGWKKTGLTVGFVPTMGALHAGHASLILRSKKENDRTIVSIFVNPKQFGPREDFSRYPRPFARDRRLCLEWGVDALYRPAAEDVYPEGFRTSVVVEELSDKLCGLFRPGHFKGVATVVLKLLEIADPDKAYFGEKDYQQLVIVKTMARDLGLPCRIVGCPTVRDQDGLALSSRNRSLSSRQRALAPLLYWSLRRARAAARRGGRAKEIVRLAREGLLRIPGVSIDYVSLVDAETLEDAEESSGPLRLLAAVRIGSARLIDNVAVDC